MSSVGTMPRDYDAARQDRDDPVDSLEELKERRNDHRVDDLGDPAYNDDGFQLSGVDLALLDEDELTVPVLPMSAGEFRCVRCFLVLACQLQVPGSGGVCRDCI